MKVTTCVAHSTMWQRRKGLLIPISEFSLEGAPAAAAAMARLPAIAYAPPTTWAASSKTAVLDCVDGFDDVFAGSALF